MAGYGCRFKNFVRDGVEASTKVRCFLQRPMPSAGFFRLRSMTAWGANPAAGRPSGEDETD